MNGGMKESYKKPKNFSLPDRVLNDWEACVAKWARLPRGTNKKEMTNEEIAALACRLEMKNITSLWETFTQEREDLTRMLLSSKEQIMAYLLGFHLSNAARMQFTLDRVEKRYALRKILGKYKTASINDLGCGTGAMSQTLVNFIQPAIKEGVLHLTDAVGGLLDCAREIHDNTPYDLLSHRKPLEDLPADRFAAPEDGVAIYTMGYVWNELDKNQRARDKLMQIFEQHVKNNEAAMIIMVDAAEQVTSRNLMDLRNQFSEMGYQPIYPCINATPCPMLDRHRDWCFSEAEWYRPFTAFHVDRKLELDHRKLSTTSMIFTSGSLTEAILKSKDSKDDPSVVVGRPQRQDNKGSSRDYFEYLLCKAGEITKAPGGKYGTPKKRGEYLRL